MLAVPFGSRRTAKLSSGGEAMRLRRWGATRVWACVASDRKILVWAHNFHVQHDATELAPPSVNMGYHVARRHRDELYTIGLFMYWGHAAWNDRSWMRCISRTTAEPGGQGARITAARRAWD